MAFLYISEFQHLGFDGSSSPVLSPKVPAAVEQQLPIDGGQHASSAWGNTTHFIMVNTDVACCLAFAESGVPTAVNSAHRLGANETRFYTVKAGGTLAVILAVA